MEKKFFKALQVLSILFIVFVLVSGYQGNLSLPVLRKGPDKVAIVKATVEEGGNASSYPGAVCDGNVNTYWQPAVGAPVGKIALQFEDPQLLYGLTLCAELASGSALRIEYDDGGIWVPAPCAPIVGDGVFHEHSLNLSPLRIVTGKIRLVVPGGDKIYDLSVCGIPAGEVYHRLVPETVETAVPDNAYSSVANLFDNNTYTVWQSGDGRLGPDDPGCVMPRRPWKRIREKDGMDRNTIRMIYPEGTRLEEVRFMPIADENAGIRIEARNGNDVVRLSDSYGRLQEDWYIVSGRAVGNIRQIKVTLESRGRKDVGLREFECWGYGAYAGRKYLPLGDTRPRTLNSPETFFFRNTEDDDGILWIIMLGERTDTLSVLVNTVSYSIAPLKNTDGSTLYRIKPRPGAGESGDQTLTILPPAGKPATLYGVWLASGDADGEQEEDLYRSLATAALPGKPERLFSERLLLQDMETTGRVIGFLMPEGFVNGTWAPLERFDEGSLWSRYRLPSGSDGKLGGIRFSGGIIRDNLEGIRVLGSVYSDHAPVVRILKPAAGEEIGDAGRHDFEYYIVGYTDKSEATVTVNGKKAKQLGHYFWQPIGGPDLQRDGSLLITAVARDREGREGRDEITVSLADFLFTVNLTEGVTWTNRMSIEVMGTVKIPHVEMKVNGKNVPVIGNSYATKVPLSEGMNIILIHGKDTRSGKERTATRRVYCSQQGVILEIENPQNGACLGAENCIVSGRVSGPGPLRVTVNGVEAIVTGSFYRSGAVSLAEGANTITVKVYNRQTKLAEKSITVYRDTLKPVISSIVPEENSLLNHDAVSVRVTVSDASPVWVFVNGKQAVMEGNAYCTIIPLADGRQEINVFAEDRAGNRSTTLRHVTVDTTPPLPFTVSITPPGWTNVKQPVVTFATSDATSGIDHYELSIDNGPYQIVTSPYQLPELADGMHKIRVKAIDRAGWERLAEAEAWIDTTPPATPADFKVIPGNAKAILSYTAVSSDTTGFKIERVPLWSETETVKTVSGLTWTDEGLVNGRLYCYRVQAVDRAGNVSPFSEWITIESGVELEAYNPQKATIAEFDGATLTIAVEGLFPETAAVRIRVVESEVLAEDKAFPGVSPVFEFEAVDSSGLPVKSGETLPKYYLGAIRYDESLIPEGLTEDDLDVYYFDTMWGRWMRCDSLVDKNANLVYFTTNHFSFYEVQATAIKDLTPDEIKKSGYSPFRTYMEHGSFDVAPDNGSLTNRVTELVLPGPGGFDLTIARTYTTAQAKADAFVVMDQILAPYVAEKANFAFTVGKGIRLDLPYIKNTGDNKYIVLPGGGGYSFFEMDLDTSNLKEIDGTYTETYWVSGWYIWGYDEQGNYVPVDYHPGYYITRTESYSYKKGSIVMTPHGSKDFELSVGMVIGERRIVTLSDDSRIAFRNSYTTGLEIDSFPDTSRPHYRLLMNDGTEYFFDSEGRPIRITDPTGLHSINIFYKEVKIGTGNFSGIDFIQDAVGRKVYFDYTAIGGLPYISKIRVNDDGAYQRVITYAHDARGYLIRETDAGGRNWEYQYVDFSVPAKQTLIPFNFYKYVESGRNTLLLDIILKQYENEPMQFRNCPLLKELRGPGKGIIRAEYAQFTESDSGFTVVSDIKVFADEGSYSNGQPQRWTTYRYYADSYMVLPAGVNIPADKRGYIKRTTANDWNRVTEYYFEAFLQKNARWVIKDYEVQTGEDIIKTEMGKNLYSVSTRRVKIERKDIMAAEPIREVEEFIYNTPATEAGKASVRPDAKKTIRGTDWAQTNYTYDAYGNIIKEETEMHSSGRTNKTIAYRAYNTNPDVWNSQEGFKPYSGAGSPSFSVPEFSRVRRNLLLREMVANYTPTFSQQRCFERRGYQLSV